MVEITAHWQGALNLYNNGFAGGLTAILVVALCSGFLRTKEEAVYETEKEFIGRLIGEMTNYLLESDPLMLVVSCTMNKMELI